MGWISVAAVSSLRSLMLIEFHGRFELFVLQEGEKKITEKVVSGRLHQPVHS